MDGNHPKRRKDKYDPYTISTTEDGRHWLTFSDGQGNRHHFEISAAVFTLFDSFSTAMSTLNFTARLVHPSISAICS